MAKIYSEEGAGCTIKLYLPRLRGTDQPKPETSAEPIATGEGRILAVEDDPLLRAQVVRQLRELGYSVSAAEGAQEALQLFSAGQRFDLLFSDVMMPGGLNGRQLADQAKIIQGDLRVVLSSGYTQDGVALQGPMSDYPMLGKPYRKAELAKVIAQTLRGGDSHPAAKGRQ